MDAAAVVQARLLLRHSATLGKCLFRIVVRSAEGSPATLVQLLVLRPLVEAVLLALGFTLSMTRPESDVGTALSFWILLLTAVDALWILRGDRRCLHDHIARTVVLREKALASDKKPW